MAQINSHMFRDYDIRGVAGEDLNQREAELIGKAFGTYLKRRGESEVFVGRDCRLSSPQLCNSLVRGLTSTGCFVRDIGLASWGFVNYALRQGKGNAVFVTASHNPAKYNGFKLVVQSESLPGPQIAEVLALVQRGDFEGGNGKKEAIDLHESYVSFLKSKVKIGKKLKIVIDCGNGMASLFAPRILGELGIEVICLYCELDGTFPNHPADPVVAENLADLKKSVVENQADLGIAFDGDGDRIGVIGRKGEIIWGDQLTAVFAKDILEKRRGSKIVFEVNCSLALAEVIEKHGGKPLEVRVGHTFIEDTLRKEKALLAGEMSGHLFFADDFYGIDDAVYNSLRLIELISRKGDVSSLLADYPHYYSSPQLRVHCDDDKKKSVVSDLVKEFKEQGFKVSTIDGAKVIFPDGWGLARVSNTAPQLTFRFEGKTQAALQRIEALFAEKVKKHGVGLWRK
ncbi:phosphomannomutase/phosphoglucomutase [Candidatus Micrarchaeota archaeon]|nr:phosphomannomutase/phosphoglucomutase [Candidatus Micrarchaeota archaeon]